MDFSYDQFMMFFYIGIGLSIAFLIVSVMLFVTLKIPRIWSELSGSTERKAIREIREKNSQPKMTRTEEMGADVYKQMQVSVQDRKKSITSNEKVYAINENIETTMLSYSSGAVSLTENDIQNQLNNNETEILENYSETSLLPNIDETELLTQNNVTKQQREENKNLKQNYQGTIVEENNIYYGQTQVFDDGETEVLYETNELVDFQILEEIVLCASNEIVV